MRVTSEPFVCNLGFIAFFGTFICNSRLNSCSANYQIFILFSSDVFIIYCTVYEIFTLIFKRRDVHYLHRLELPLDISKMITRGRKTPKDASQVCRPPHGVSVPEENTWQENYAIKADAGDHPALLGAPTSSSFTSLNWQKENLKRLLSVSPLVLPGFQVQDRQHRQCLSGTQNFSKLQAENVVEVPRLHQIPLRVLIPASTLS